MNASLLRHRFLFISIELEKAFGARCMASRASNMDPKLECLNINCSADEVADYIDRFNFWIDTRGMGDEKAIKGTFLTAVGKYAFPC